MIRMKRETKETSIHLTVDKEGGGIQVETGNPFLTHMVETLARYGGLGLQLEATGDLKHHLIEDVGIALGSALAREAPDTAARYGWAVVPMDEALAEAAVDVGGRPYYVGPLPSRLYEHFLQSLAVNLGATLHIRVIRGRDRHHMVEAAIKAFGLALRQALAPGDTVFSTKGSVSLTIEGEDT
jgi:imidazoleglycerol-phosphate dehydratase